MKLVHASISETGGAGWNGKAKAGDQTKKEVCVRAWYFKPWWVMLRYHDKKIAAKAACAAVRLANSNLVGYDQSERNSLYRALKTYNFDVDAYIRSGKKTETDCSAFVYAVYCCFIPAMRSDNNAPVTSTMRNFYKRYGFSVKTNSSYLSGKGLLSGDILLKDGSHTAIATDGKTRVTSSGAGVVEAITVIAQDVICGKWGNGNDRKENLYNAVQKRVNEIVNKKKLSTIHNTNVDVAITIMAKDVIRGGWGNGNDRKEKLYNAVQKRVNELL